MVFVLIVPVRHEDCIQQRSTHASVEISYTFNKNNFVDWPFSTVAAVRQLREMVLEYFGLPVDEGKGHIFITSSELAFERDNLRDWEPWRARDGDFETDVLLQLGPLTLH